MSKMQRLSEIMNATEIWHRKGWFLLTADETSWKPVGGPYRFRHDARPPRGMQTRSGACCGTPSVSRYTPLRLADVQQIQSGCRRVRGLSHRVGVGLAPARPFHALPLWSRRRVRRHLHDALGGHEGVEEVAWEDARLEEVRRLVIVRPARNLSLLTERPPPGRRWVRQAAESPTDMGSRNRSLLPSTPCAMARGRRLAWMTSRNNTYWKFSPGRRGVLDTK